MNSTCRSLLLSLTLLASYLAPTSASAAPCGSAQAYIVKYTLVAASDSVGALQYSTNYSAAAGEFSGTGASVNCSNLLGISLFAPNDLDAARILTLGNIALTEFAAPLDLASCVFQGTAANPPVPGNFKVSIDAATDGDGNPITVSVAVSITPSGSPVPNSACCGNGVVDGGEQCDDGNLSNGDACLNSCLNAKCGDGVVRVGAEECDDGNLSNEDTCLNSCVNAGCGATQSYTVKFRLAAASKPVGGVQYRTVYSSATGDFVGSNADVSCTNLVSGALFAAQDTDASRQLALGHLTLSGFPAPQDLASCVFQGVPADAPTPSDFPVVVEDATDADGNPVSVSITVLVTPVGSPVASGACCGNGVVDSGEQCDDQNLSNTDACLNSCTTARCGDGYVRPGFETCDDGNALNTDACLNTCTPSSCGDGFVRSGLEQCDDGNKTNSDACLNNCVTAKCGDSVVRIGVEQCDDGNLSNNDSCLTTCSNARCGDGVLRVGLEQCDDGNVISTDSCLSNCATAVCGDGFVRAGVEQCDDGGPVSGDGCDINCTTTACGNEVVTAGEQCDDGNRNNADACPGSCVPAFCGDGFVRFGVEECDDSNVVNGDGCSKVCEIQQLCGDATDDGKILASDALRILLRSVGLDVECPTWICNVDAKNGVSASDALRTLQVSVDLPIALACGVPTAILVRISSSALLGSLQINIDYEDVAGEIPGSGGSVDCQAVQPGVQAAFNDKPERILSASFATLAEMRGPGTIARCGFSATGSVFPGDFFVSVLDAKAPGEGYSPKPAIRVVPD